MKIKAFKTHKIKPGESLFQILDKYLPSLEEEAIVVVTSKIISLCEKSVVSHSEFPNKLDLVKSHADAYLADKDETSSMPLTIKNNIFIPSSGIDESNGDGLYVLYPRNVQKTAAEIWLHLRKKHSLGKCGVIITDSCVAPLRRGVTGVGIGWCGFKPLYNYIGTPDCFGNILKVTQVNIIDALAASAVFLMGEGNEQTPIALITHAPKIEFQDRPPSDQELQDITISPEDDLFGSLLREGNWVFKKS